MLRKINTIKYLGMFWAIIGLTLILTYAIVRLTPHSIEALRRGLSFIEWIILLVWCGFMLFAEGYKGFHKQFSPRFVSRALYLFKNPRLTYIVFAPLFCMGYIHSSLKRKLTAWILSLSIVVLVLGVKLIAQPWRGIIDVGVILGLMYGLASVYYWTARVIISKNYEVDPEVE